MKTLKSMFSTVLFLFILLTVQIQAQSWTAEQKEVWAGIQEYWDVSAKGNADAFLKYFDESYVGWSYVSKVPQDKSNTGKWIKHDMSKNSTVLHTLTPVTIWVNGDFAFANYFYSQIEKDKEGKEKPSTGHWTDILMKKNGKWLLVGDRGGRTSKDQ
jgi:ketosteroid isomerase-like protein